jgi:ATP-binding cassette subfamily C protein LapB
MTMPVPASHPAALDGPDAPRPLIAPWLAEPLKENRGAFLQVALAAVFINLFALATSLFAMTVYDRVVPNNATNSLVVLSIGIGIVLVFDFVLKTLRGWFIDWAGARIDRQVGGAIFRRLMDMRLSSRRGSTGGFAGSLREFETIRDFFASATLAAIVDVPFILLFLAVIALIGGWVVLVPLALAPLVILASLLLQRPMARLTAEAMRVGLTKQGVLVEAVGGLETVKATGAAPLLTERWDAAVDAHASISMRQRALAALGVNIAQLAQTLAYVGTTIVGVALIARGELTMGGLIACSILSSRAVAPLAQIANLMTRIAHTRAAYREIDRMMAEADAVTAPAWLRRDRLDGAIAFDDVSFRYPGAAAPALDRVRLAIRPGERVGILGRTGSGKSTLARLILGLYEPSEGSVLIDGSDVRQIHPEDLRRNIGTVLQEVTLLSGSVRDNIALGRPDASDAEVLRAARLAGVHDFIGRVPNGYALHLADRGEGLSGGQKQAIAVARALLGERPILLLDEPTSAMDTASETALIARLDELARGRTLMLITHRLPMLRLVERLIVLDHGRIVADGPRDAVLARLRGGQRPAEGAPSGATPGTAAEDAAAGEAAAGRAGSASRPAAERADGASWPAAERADGASRPAAERADGASRPAVEGADGASRPAAERADGASRPAVEGADGASWPAAERADGASRPAAEPGGQPVGPAGQPVGPAGQPVGPAVQPAAPPGNASIRPLPAGIATITGSRRGAA